MDLEEYLCRKEGFSAAEANGIIMAGKALVNDEVCLERHYILKDSDRVRVKYEKKKYATRSGYKLEKALAFFQVSAQDKLCLDVGASEGGFTDCLLQHGAAKVYAVDVAYGILNWKLRSDSRVVPLERVNARYLDETKVPESCDLLTVDVSFISSGKILPQVCRLLKPEGRFLLLFKPQFELKKEYVKKNGNIADISQIAKAIAVLAEELREQGIYFHGVTYSPIRGNNGNVEFLLCGGMTGPGGDLSEEAVQRVVDEAFAALQEGEEA